MGIAAPAFRIFDRNGDGYIDAKELEVVLRQGEGSVTSEPEASVSLMLKEATGAGSMSYKDFAKFVRSGAGLEL